jgi:exportin-1
MDVASASSKLLDFSSPVDVKLLELVVNASSEAAGEQRQQAEQILLKYQDNPQAWQQVDNILSQSQSQGTKYFALQVRPRTFKSFH